ncbi:hypothetical protein ACHAXA_011293 [Cyclostephanos tholiformis]|uniref:Rubisco LSMT substrate-binding domain-containing protein n=1 Tax=Cyclostephanos tholiformis TaxID=382380 RepID=A0ABD3RJL9_9STRA
MSVLHPLMWTDRRQEAMQRSSTKKIYRLLDDIDDDSTWLNEKLWSSDRTRFPETVSLRVGGGNGEDGNLEERPCFTPLGFRYAVSLVRSRSFYVDGYLRLLPYLDYANHDDYGTREIGGGSVGTSFDVIGGSGSTGEPDPAMMQFLRLAKLGGKDAFLLESIFRGDVWGFMSEPVSEDNEREVVNAVIEACQSALSEMTSEGEGENDSGEESSSKMDRLCSMVCESEREALGRTLTYMRQEAEALDLKEYYQERRLKSLGLDSDWTPEDDVSFGGTRLPGTANYDW